MNMQGTNARQLAAIEKVLSTVNAAAPAHGRLSFVETVPFGASLTIDRYQMDNGLALLLCEDKSAPVVSVHTWFRVGSRHEHEGKTGLAHLFEHLMFNEIEGRGAGFFDRTLEEAGAESNASTWLDWTQYNIAIPKEQLGLVLELEAERMSKLVLREPQVTSEKEVVANERRYRVDDDVEGAVSELLWATAFTKHAYKWPTIGWMKDIEGFTTEDCESFYRAFYAPNNATLIISGDFKLADVLSRVSKHYGVIPASVLPLEDAQPEPPQTSERRVEVKKPTTTEKAVVGYHAPALGDFDHPAISLLSEVLFGGRASRMHQRLVRELELASEVRAFVGPFHDPGLFELYLAAREGHTAEELLAALDEELEKVVREPVTPEEMARASARFELGLLGGLETADGKASTIGFYEAVLGRPAAAFERLEATRRLTQSDLLRAARRYLDPRQRSVILVRPDLSKATDSDTEAEAAE
jgi:zinc protease